MAAFEFLDWLHKNKYKAATLIFTFLRGIVERFAFEHLGPTDIQASEIDWVSTAGDREEFPFVVKVVRTDEQLEVVRRLRQVAYSKHVPEFGSSLGTPDLLDHHDGVVIFFAEEKFTGAIIGTARIQPNFSRALELETEVTLPPHIATASCCEITRFAVLPSFKDKFHRINRALSKACYLYCLSTQIRYMVIGSRKSLVRSYQSLGFNDVFEDRKLIRLGHAGHIEHRVLYFDVTGAERRWHSADLENHRYFCEVVHPDIQIFSSVAGSWTRPRQELRLL